MGLMSLTYQCHHLQCDTYRHLPFSGETTAKTETDWPADSWDILLIHDAHVHYKHWIRWCLQLGSEGEHSSSPMLLKHHSQFSLICLYHITIVTTSHNNGGVLTGREGEMGSPVCLGEGSLFLISGFLAVWRCSGSESQLWTPIWSMVL